MAVTLIDKTIMNQQVCIWSLAVKYVHLFASWEILHGKALTTVFSHNITCSYLRKIVRLLKLATKSRNLLVRENSRYLTTPSLVSPRNYVWETSTEIPYRCRVTTQSWKCFLLVVTCGKFASTNQKHYPDLTRHQHGISVLVSQTSFRGETSGGLAKCRLFSPAA